MTRRIRLHFDGLAPSPPGCWVRGGAEVLRVTRRWVFAQGITTVDGLPALRISGIFTIGKALQMPGSEGG